MVIGIDPGAGGAIAFLSGGVVVTVDMPCDTVKSGKTQKRRVSAARLAVEIRAAIGGDADRGLRVTAFVEQVGAMPGQGVSSMFAFGRATGVVEGVLAALGVPTTLVPPSEWKRLTRCPAGKDGARARAAQVFPTAAAQFSRAKDDGRAEAALIAYHGASIERMMA